MRKILLFVYLVSIFVLNITYAGTTGKLTGKATDAKTKEALPFVNVTLLGTNLGAATDIDGNYVILNIPPGRYSVRAQSVGYQATVRMYLKKMLPLRNLQFQPNKSVHFLWQSLMIFCVCRLVLTKMLMVDFTFAEVDPVRSHTG